MQKWPVVKEKDISVPFMLELEYESKTFKKY